MAHTDLIFRDLVPIGASKVDELRRSYSGLPDDYFDFLEGYGAGTIGDSKYAIYNEPVQAEEIFGKPCDVDKEILALSDDFAGNVFGFDPKQASYVLITPPQRVQSVSEGMLEFLSQELSYLA